MSDEMPTQSVIQGFQAIQEEQTAAQVRAEGYFARARALESALKKEKQRPLQIINVSDFEKNYEKPASPAKTEQWREWLRM